jgi:mRNA interferase HicA
MKRTALIRHIEAHGAVYVREGGEHTIYRNPRTNRSSSIPRHNEINDITAANICKQLSVPKP